MRDKELMKIADYFCATKKEIERLNSVLQRIEEMKKGSCFEFVAYKGDKDKNKFIDSIKVPPTVTYEFLEKCKEVTERQLMREKENLKELLK